jgi:hypothetical protein
MTCKDCIKLLEDLKSDLGKSQFSELWHYEQALAKTIELLQSDRIVELPCNVGEEVYVLNRGNIPQKMILGEPDIRCHCPKEAKLCMALCDDTKHNICAYPLKNDGSDIGEKVFLTKEEAEEKLKELNGNEKA